MTQVEPCRAYSETDSWTPAELVGIYGPWGDWIHVPYPIKGRSQP